MKNSLRELLPRSVWIAALLIAALLGCIFWRQPSVRTAWDEYRAEQVANGEWLDWPDHVPHEQPPKDANFAATPLLRQIGRRGQSSARFEAHVSATGLSDQLGNSGDWTRGQPADLDFIRARLAGKRLGDGAANPQAGATAVLAALRAVEEELAELRAASLRPHAKFEFSYPDPI